MSRPPSTQPTDGELTILKVLWENGPLELGPLRDRLQVEKAVASTTVATMLKVMVNKGLLERKSGSHGFRWFPMLSREQVASSLVSRLLNHIFEGSAQSLVTHLLGDGKLSKQDRRQIVELLEAGTARKSKPARKRE